MFIKNPGCISEKKFASDNQIWVSQQVLLRYLDPGDSLLRLHHPGGLGGLALAHELGGPQVSRTEQNSLYQNFWIRNRAWKNDVWARMLFLASLKVLISHKLTKLLFLWKNKRKKNLFYNNWHTNHQCSFFCKTLSKLTHEQNNSYLQMVCKKFEC